MTENAKTQKNSIKKIIHQRFTISIWTYTAIVVYLFITGVYIYQKSQENLLDMMCPEPYICVVPDPEHKGLQLRGLTTYKKILI